ncbi:signal peptidase I [uncultured Dubosiella sp.]|uniref:signal peptidase I n=2 Tax=uncultured Dubosiella sp. TaxID=1937011 RepID=UPI0025B51841|nr:signal peptidase I [uncultured Dubosiella sp.]
MRTRKQGVEVSMPSLALLIQERDRVRHNQKYKATLRSTIAVLIVVAAFAVLAATMWMPVLQIYGNSMTPTLNEGEIVLSLKGSGFKTGDVIAFYYNNKVLVKRVIAGPGDWVYIEDDGTVYVNGEELQEPYLQEKALGETDIEYPYQVPEDRWFVMGDHRSVSMDSRKKSIGPVAEEQIIGKLTMKLWPLTSIGGV